MTDVSVSETHERLRVAICALVGDPYLSTLSTRCLAILLVVATSHGPHTIRGIASSLRVPKPSVTRGVDSLEAAELAVRRPDLNDGRSVLIEPTQRGLELVARLGAVMRAAAAAPKVEPVIEPAVGQRIRACRIPAATYRAELNALVGVSQPQLPRFEVGLTRVAAGLLISITSALGVPVGSGETDQLDLLLRAFSKINQPKRRSALLALADCMADAEVHIAPPACAEIELLLRACIDIPEPKRRSAL